MGDVPEMVDRAARAISFWQTGAEGQWMRFVPCAREVIEAIRKHEFGDMVLFTEGKPAVTLSGEAPTAIFRALIDAALASQGNGRETE